MKIVFSDMFLANSDYGWVRNITIELRTQQSDGQSRRVRAHQEFFRHSDDPESVAAALESLAAKVRSAAATFAITPDATTPDAKAGGQDGTGRMPDKG